MKCRFCSNPLDAKLIDLGSSPLSNAILTAKQLHQPETWLPLAVFICGGCSLAQLGTNSQNNKLFENNYSYFSGYSSSWAAHCEDYADTVIDRFSLNKSSKVVEIASNDGTLLNVFQKKGFPCLGIEPTASTANVARQKGLEVISEFFGEKLAIELRSRGEVADLMVANNVLAHVPNIEDFLKGFVKLLADEGTATFEFPHLANLVKEYQFDTIYHEHYFYFSLEVVQRIFREVGLEIFDVEEITTHGGSLRLYAQKKGQVSKPVSERVGNILDFERKSGLGSLERQGDFQAECDGIKHKFLRFLVDAKSNGQSIVGYGAAAKGNTFLNYCGVRQDLISYVVDKNPAKQGHYLPGSRIPIVDEQQIKLTKPDYIVILPWNLEKEIKDELEYVREWEAKFVVAIPDLRIT